MKRGAENFRRRLVVRTDGVAAVVAADGTKKTAVVRLRDAGRGRRPLDDGDTSDVPSSSFGFRRSLVVTIVVVRSTSRTLLTGVATRGGRGSAPATAATAASVTTAAAAGTTTATAAGDSPNSLGRRVRAVHDSVGIALLASRTDAVGIAFRASRTVTDLGWGDPSGSAAAAAAATAAAAAAATATASTPPATSTVATAAATATSTATPGDLFNRKKVGFEFRL